MINERFRENEDSHSLLGFGCMRLPINESEGSINEELAQEMIDLAFASGVNYFDTAYMYHDGKSETFLKKALANYPRESYFLTDKMPPWMLKEKADMDKMFNEQLERCGVEYFDYYLAHSLSKSSVENMRKLDMVDFLKQKKAEGKIRHIGFSFHDDADCLRDILTMHDWEFCQLQLNYADWNRYGAKELYEIAGEHDLPVIVMEPVRGGFLANPPAEVAELLREAAPNRSLASWALRFVASLPSVKLVLSGMSDMEQVRDNLVTFADPSIYLSDKEQAVITKAMEILDNINSVPCTGCRYCMPCPSGVEIPKIFDIYNKVTLFGKRENNYAESIPAENCASQCTSCGACMIACPQHIDIPGKLAEAHALLTQK